MDSVKIEKIKKIVSKFKDVKILTIGDLILDQFIWGKVERISPEAPVPVVWVDSESFMPGGASNVARNIRALGGTAFISGLIGEDKNGGQLLCELERDEIKIGGIFVDRQRPTTVKTRIIAHNQQVVRVDRERIEHIDNKLINKIIAYVEENIDDFDAVIIEDYGKGLISPRLLKKILPVVKKAKKIITVDPKKDHFSYYKGVTSITPNRAEAENAAGLKIKNEKDIERVARKIVKKLKLESVLITLGEQGMCLLQGDKVTRIPTVAQEVFDVSGAGDTVIATFTLALAAGASFKEAAVISNYASGIVVGKVGTAVTTQKELIDSIKKMRK